MMVKGLFFTFKGDVMMVRFQNVGKTNDIALEQATREKVVLTLGVDPAITTRAFEASRLYLAKVEAEKKIEEFKTEFRAYAAKKRDVWNEANEDKVKTVKIPFRLKTERGEEIRHVSVTCSASYSVDNKIVGQLKREFPSQYNELFVEEVKSVLRPRGKEILASQFKAAGFDNKKIEKIFEEVFENDVSIKPVEDFEFKIDDVVKNSDKNVKRYIDLGVKRAAPAVTFEIR